MTRRDNLGAPAGVRRVAGDKRRCLTCADNPSHLLNNPRPSRAVFLSYVSQDAEAARRICDALLHKVGLADEQLK